MTVTITVVGLGQIGTSVGLALEKEKEKFVRIGSDGDMVVSHRAEKMGAFDKTVVNLHKAVEGADIVVLAVPVDELRSTLETIGSDLKPGAVVLDTSIVRVAAEKWASKYIPEDRYFVGFVPSINPDYLEERELDVDSAHADLFKNSLITITSQPGMDADALSLAYDLASMLGASVYFSDAHEIDGLNSAGQLLPMASAAALINTLQAQPGWQETRKVAGRALTEASLPLINQPESKTYGTAMLENRDNVIRLLDDLIQGLAELRDLLKEGDADSLHAWMERATSGRKTWLRQRHSADWSLLPRPELPGKSDMFRQLFGLTGLKRQGKDKK